MDNLDFTPAEKYVVEAVAALNGGRSLPPVPGGAWPAVRRELQAQTVECLFADHLGEMRLSPEDEIEYIKDFAGNAKNWHKVMSGQDEALFVLGSAGIPVAVIKGSAAAMYYPRPEVRTMGDIDLIARPQDFSLAARSIQNAGWVPQSPYKPGMRHANFKSAGGVLLELHNHFSDFERKNEYTELDKLIFRDIEKTGCYALCGFSFPVLPPVTNGLVLLQHLNHHLSCGVGFRQVMDWAMFVKANPDGAFWDEQFLPIAQELGLGKLAQNATASCQAHFGLQSDMAWHQGVDPELTALFAARVVAKGNFGGKQSFAETETRQILRRLRSPAVGIKYLSETGAAHWPPAQRHKWLAPAACAWQVGHLVRTGLARGIRPSDFLRHSSDSADEGKLLSKLGATRL